MHHTHTHIYIHIHTHSHQGWASDASKAVSQHASKAVSHASQAIRWILPHSHAPNGSVGWWTQSLDSPPSHLLHLELSNTTDKTEMVNSSDTSGTSQVNTFQTPCPYSSDLQTPPKHSPCLETTCKHSCLRARR